MKKRKKKNEFKPCAFNHSSCFACRKGMCRLLADMDFHGKDCTFYATKQQVNEQRKQARERLVSIGAAELLNYPKYKANKEKEEKKRAKKAEQEQETNDGCACEEVRN